MSALAAIRGQRGGMTPRAQIRDCADHHRSATILISMSVVGILMSVLPQVWPLAGIQNKEPWFDAFANAGIYVLLAMGLNVVIGLTGLLDRVRAAGGELTLTSPVDGGTKLTAILPF